ncbi:MAG: DsbA family protein [Candidatus Binatia bacterium]
MVSLLWCLVILFDGRVDAGALDAVAAVVDGQEISVAEVDTLSGMRAEQIREELTAFATYFINRLIDEYLTTLPASETVTVPSPPPISDEEVRAYQAMHAQESDEPGESQVPNPVIEAATVRRYLERKAREGVEIELRQQLRRGHEIRLLLPQVQELAYPLLPGRQLAQVDRHAIRAAALEDGAALRLYRLRQELYHERRQAIDRAITNRLLAREARRRGLTTAAFLARLSARTKVEDTEVQAFLAMEERVGRVPRTPEQARLYLEFRKGYEHQRTVVEKLRAAAAVKIVLPEPEVPRLPMVETGATAFGVRQGARLMVYTNYCCPTCRAMHQEIDTLLTQNKKVRVFFRDFIPGYDPVATEAALLSRCAASVGALPRMRKELLTREPPRLGTHWFGEEELVSLIRKLRINRDVFSQCLAAEETYQAIERDTAHARELGFNEAPAFVAEGIPFSGLQSAESLAQALQKSLEVQPQTSERDTRSKRKRRGSSRNKRGKEARAQQQSQRATVKSPEQTSSVFSNTRRKERPGATPTVRRLPPPKTPPTKLFDFE